VTQVMRPDYTIKGKQKKIAMSNSQPTKIIRDKIEKKQKKNKKIKIKIMRTKFDTQLTMKSNHEGYN